MDPREKTIPWKSDHHFLVRLGTPSFTMILVAVNHLTKRNLPFFSGL